MNKREKILIGMNEMMCNANDERHWERWICLIPDGADEEELREIANDDELFEEAVNLFYKIIEDNFEMVLDGKLY